MTTRYATLAEMLDMEAGVTGNVVVIGGDTYELRTNGEASGWVHIYPAGDDWDGISEEDARELKLWPL